MNAPTDPMTAPEGTACRSCGGRTIGWGKDRQGNARRRCKSCGVTVALVPVNPLGTMRLDMEKAVLCLSLLTEGSSIRSTERVSGVHRDTICRLLRVAGAKCETILSRLVRNVPVKDVQADELWCFVGMKEKTKVRKAITDSEIGDAYTFLAVERDSKLLLASHVGRRRMPASSPPSSLEPWTVAASRFQPMDSTDTLPPWNLTSAARSTMRSSSSRTRVRDWTASGGTARRR